jgi:NAD(P)-dependent dehydrogenase (short-subunit alcohol dehydrogenase family)
MFQNANQRYHADADLLGSVRVAQLDVTSDDCVEACAALAEERFGRLDALINNAVVFDDNVPGEPMLRKKFRKFFETNVFGATCLTEAFMPVLPSSHLNLD